jgi:hypothetical protein
MKSLCITIVFSTAILIAGCWKETKRPMAPPVPTVAPASVTRPERAIQTVKLQCRARNRECFSFYSFTAGVLAAPPANPDQVDLVYYFDADDCSRGALVGRDDRPGYLFPVGHRSWDELAALTPPLKDSLSVAGITPLTQEQVGLAFWVKARGGQYYLVRIAVIQPATYSELVMGKTATVEFEWTGPGTGGGK